MSRNHHVQFHMSKKQQKSTVDKLVAIAAVLYPLSTIPQIISVFQDAGGVSLPAWVGYQVFSIIFLLYGISYKLKPVVVTQVLWVIVNSLVIAGILSHRL